MDFRDASRVPPSLLYGLPTEKGGMVREALVVAEAQSASEAQLGPTSIEVPEAMNLLVLPQPMRQLLRTESRLPASAYHRRPGPVQVG